MLAPPAKRGGWAIAFCTGASRGGTCVWAITPEVPIKLHAMSAAAARPIILLGWFMAILASLTLFICSLPQRASLMRCVLFDERPTNHRNRWISHGFNDLDGSLHWDHLVP